MSWSFKIIVEMHFSEILRIIDSVQLTDSHKVATPVDWKVLFFLLKYSVLIIKNPLFQIIRSATNVWFFQQSKTKIAPAFFRKALQILNYHPENVIYVKHLIQPWNRIIYEQEHNIAFIFPLENKIYSFFFK